MFVSLLLKSEGVECLFEIQICFDGYSITKKEQSINQSCLPLILKPVPCHRDHLVDQTRYHRPNQRWCGEDFGNI